MDGGFVQVPNELVRNPGITAAELRVWCFIASHDPEFVYLVDYACERTGMSGKTWSKAVKGLVKKGLLRVSRGSCNRYTALPPYHEKLNKQ